MFDLSQTNLTTPIMSISIHHLLDINKRAYAVVFRSPQDLQTLESRIKSAIEVDTLEESICDAGMDLCDYGHLHYGGISLLRESAGHELVIVSSVRLPHFEADNLSVRCRHSRCLSKAHVKI